MPRGEEIRRRWANSNAEMYASESRSKTAAARIYPHLTDASTRQRIASDWQAQRQRPSKRFKRRPFKRRGEEESER
jgi:hypothetical protein